MIQCLYIASLSNKFCTSSLGLEMARFKGWVCAILILALVAKTECRPIPISRTELSWSFFKIGHAHAVRVYRRIENKKEVFKAPRLGKEWGVKLPYESNRRSPMGPDPQHHVIHLK